jgi:hypothetical protein
MAFEYVHTQSKNSERKLFVLSINDKCAYIKYRYVCITHCSIQFTLKISRLIASISLRALFSKGKITLLFLNIYVVSDSFFNDFEEHSEKV